MKLDFRFLVICFGVLSGCERWQHFEDLPVTTGGTKILWHRAGGGSVDSLPENSLKSIDHTILLEDGIECDIQLSADGSIWLSHDLEWRSCEGKTGCFPETKDADIEKLNECSGVQYTLLDSVFALLKYKYIDKMVSLDVKRWFPCALSSANIPRQMNQMAVKICKLVKYYQLEGRVLVESDSKIFLKNIKDNNKGIETYLLVLGQFEQGYKDCLVHSIDGLSFKFESIETIGPEHVAMMHKKGKRIQLWNVTSSNLAKAKLCDPDFIQLDFGL